MKMRPEEDNAQQHELTKVFAYVVARQADDTGLTLFSAAAALAMSITLLINRHGGDAEDLDVFLNTTRSVFTAFPHLMSTHATSPVRH